ncbi:MAG: hypothetical protein V5B32_10225 [Candidatus Accumulibacter sp. UW26]|jgi:hypothetical protein
MKDYQPQVKQRFAGLDEQIEAFVSSACAGDIAGMREQVAEGLDVNDSDAFGDTLLEQVIGSLGFCPPSSRYPVIKEMLRLGADPCGLNADGSTPLFSAVLTMDTELLRILLDGGADPNAILLIPIDVDVGFTAANMQAMKTIETMDESLYDWAEFAYRYEVWDTDLPEEPGAADQVDQDAWLRFLDRLALKYGKRRPDFLRLLRQRGALAITELRQRSEFRRLLAQHRVSPVLRFEQPARRI